MTRGFDSFGKLLLLATSILPLAGADAQLSEVAALHRWAEAKFAARPVAAVPETNVILRLTPDAFVRKNLEGHPFLIAGQNFSDGIAMRSVGEIVIQAPAGVGRFTATLGVDGNDIGYYSNAGRGSVVAAVTAEGKELYRSPVLHEGLQAIPINLDLRGAKEFSIRLEAVGTRSPTYQAEWDQADWADAKLVLSNGQVQALSDLPTGPLPAQESIDPPFSFLLDGQPSSALLPGWGIQRDQHRLDAYRTEYTLQYRDPSARLSVRERAVVYDDFPSVEWTLTFKNDSSSRSGLIENVRPLDTEFERGSEVGIAVHHSKGSMSLATDFEPLITTLASSAKQQYSSNGGRPTDGDMPYFNVAWPNRGIIAALGWPGQWDFEISRERPQSVHLRGGQSGTHFRLLPGEEVRTPLVVIQFWSGDWIDGQNVWRQWMVQHNLPRPGGRLPPPQIAAGSAHFTIEMQEANEENQKSFLLHMLTQGIPIDHWWMDAGWYKYRNDWSKVGTWEIDPSRFPHGLKPISDVAHEHGIKTILWFEPERVTEGTWLATHHPEWLIGTADHDRLLYLGNPDAWRWLVERISNFISQQGIDVYRQDFNFEPLPRWQSNDAPDRQGISEIRHVEGYLAFLDELRRRFPDLLLDTCASGGRRLDLETLRRAVPLWRSDYPYGATPMQMQTFGLSLWVPFFGTSAASLDPYMFRSQMTPAVGLGPDPKLKGDLLNRQLKLISDWRQVASFYYGNFFPLTEYSDDETNWMAWQWAAPDGSAGILQAFRRSQSAFTSASFRLHNLRRDSIYTFEDLDSLHKIQIPGEDLMEKGISVSIDRAPDAIILKYYETAAASHVTPTR